MYDKKLSHTHRRYAAVKKTIFRYYVSDWQVSPAFKIQTFELKIDNSALTWLHHAKDNDSKLIRLALHHGNLNFTTTHVLDKNSWVQDMLSDYPANGSPVDEPKLDENLMDAPIKHTPDDSHATFDKIFALPKWSKRSSIVHLRGGGY